MAENYLPEARAGYAASLITSIGFGAYLVLAFQSIQLLLCRPKGYAKTKILVYSVIMLCLVCAWFITAMGSNELSLIESVLRPSPGDICNSLTIAQQALLVLIIWLGDGLLMWRTWTIWIGHRIVLTLPCIAYFGTLVTGIGLNIKCTTANSSGLPHQNPFLDLTTTFLCLSAFVNISSTGLIASQLLLHRRALRRIGVSAGNSSAYVSISAIFIESAAYYALVTVLYIPIRLRLPDQFIVLSALQCTAAILCPALVQLRAAQGIMYQGDVSTWLTGQGREEETQGPSDVDVQLAMRAPPGRSTLAAGEDVHTFGKNEDI